MDHATVEIFLEDNLRWKSRRNLALGLTLLAVVMTTSAVIAAALLLLY